MNKEKSDLEFKKPLYQSSEIPKDFQIYIQQLEEMLENKVLVLFITQREIRRDIVNMLFSLNQFQGQDKLESLTVLLDCSGGDADATYQIARLLRRHTKKLQFLIPRWAKSAATLLSLSADEIVMSEIAEMGPLDTQLPDPRNPLNNISALDGFKALEALRKFAIESADLNIRFWIRKIDANFNDLLESSNSFVSSLVNPIFAKFDPLDLGSYGQALRLSQLYLEKLIRDTEHGKKFKDGQQDLIDEIVWGYPSHSFAIDYEEAKRLDIKVRLCNEAEGSVIAKIIPFCMKIDYLGFVELIDKKAEKNDALSIEKKDI